MSLLESGGETRGVLPVLFLSNTTLVAISGAKSEIECWSSNILSQSTTTELAS
jgi:hypothetical protein